METKKTKRANLENKKGIFLQTGFVIVLLLVLAAFEWQTPLNDNILVNNSLTNGTEYVTPPITRPKPPPPKTTKESIPEEIKIVKNHETVKNEVKQVDVEATKNTKIEVITFIEETNVDDSVHLFVNFPPDFKNGGKEAFWRYIQSKIIYPRIASDNGISGTVHVNFVVNKKGKVINARIVRSVHPSIDNEALRVINSSPKWTPGIHEGKKVNVAFSMPVNFKLNYY